MAKRLSGLAATLALVLAACGGDGASTTTSQAPATTTSTSAPTPTTAAVPSTSAPELTTTTTQQIDVEFRGGEVVGPEEIQVQLGEMVDVWVLSDVDDEFHVHGYDLTYELAAGVPLHLQFVADVPGVFEVEVHTGHTSLFAIEVIG